MLANVLLVRYFEGWIEREDATSVAANGRKEAVLSLGALQSPDEAYRVADEQLAIFADIREQITADIEPTSDANTPYVGGWAVADVVTVPDSAGDPTDEKVMAITVLEDDDGYLSYAPEFHDVILAAQERFSERIKKLATGTNGPGS